MITNLLKNKKAFLAISVLAILLIIGTVFFVNKDAPIPVFRVTEKPYTEKIIAVGQLGLEQETTLVAQTNGTIEKFLAKPGDSVPLGALLIEIENQSKLEYVAAKSEYDRLISLQSIAKMDYNNASILYKEGAISKSDMLLKKTSYETTISQMRTAQLQLELASSNRDKYNIRVPWDSILLRSYVSSGDYVRIGDSLAEIGSVGGYKIVTELDEKYFPYITKGMAVLISVGDAKQGETKGSIDNITPQIDENTGTFEVLIAVPDGFPYKASNLTVNLEIILLKKDNAIVVPQSFLIKDNENGSKAYVLVYIKGKAVKTYIEVQATQSAKAIILKGLKPGDILVSPNSGIQDGDLVKKYKEGDAA